MSNQQKPIAVIIPDVGYVEKQVAPDELKPMTGKERTLMTSILALLSSIIVFGFCFLVAYLPN